MNKYFSLLSFTFLASMLVSCDFFSTTTYTAQEIKKASAWSDKDQAPSFETCQDLSEEEQFVCFKETISTIINTSLFEEELVSNQEIDLEIVLILIIDKSGAILLDETEGADYIFDAIPSLSSSLETAIEKLPTALPATKSNVGTYVNSKLRLPIRINASTQQ
jgi:hypothetical protein